MIIDAHIHVGDLRRADSPESMRREPVTWAGLIERLDDEGIDKAIVLPIIHSPEGIPFPFLFSPQPDLIGQIRAAREHPDRLIVFGNLDPRMGGNTARTDYGWIMERFVELGCVGIGEITAHLDADDPRVINMFRQCGAWDMPVTIHGIARVEGHYGLIDEPGAPRLERLLQEASGTTVIGHGQGFWSEIGGQRGVPLTPQAKASYPKGPIEEEGSLPRLFRSYPNLYGDLSAGSGYNAISRDEAFGLRFIDEFQDRLLFATDVCFGGQEGRMPHLGYLRRLLAEGKISQAIFDKITGGNVLRLLKRYQG